MIARFAVCSSCHHWHMQLFLMERLSFKTTILFERIQRFFAQRWTERGCCSSSSAETRCCNFADQLCATSDTSTLCNGRRNANVANFVVLSRRPKVSWKNKEKSIPSIVLSTKWICWLPEKLNTSFFLEDSGRHLHLTDLLLGWNLWGRSCKFPGLQSNQFGKIPQLRLTF